nr:carboxypeptidase B-like [Ciona intestinalis]|eukprot:XP_002121069.1 carboxypeptidase B-like [Ciona intestinalis]
MKVVIFFALLAVASAKRLFHQDQVLRIQPGGYDLKIINNLVERYPNIDFWAEPSLVRPVDIHVPRVHLTAVKVFLTRNRIDYEIFIEDLQVAIDNQKSDRPTQMSLATFDYNVYHTMDEIRAWMSDMVSTYSFVSQVNVGQSYEKSSIDALRITRSTSFNPPKFVLDCGLHSREWVAPASCLYAVKYLVEAQPGSAEYNILNEMEIVVIPIANPDGYEYSWTGDRMWRKTRSDTGHVCMGVDPNRNWDANWSGPGASASSCNDAYYGPSVMSEIEVRSQASFVGGLSNVQAYIDIHAYSQYWMYPYAWTYSKTSDENLLNTIGVNSVNAIRDVHGMTYLTGSISEVIYQASGSTVDYMYDTLGIKCSFAAELRDTGRYGFTLPERFIQPTAEETFAGLKTIANAVMAGTCQ